MKLIKKNEEQINKVLTAYGLRLRYMPRIYEIDYVSGTVFPAYGIYLHVNTEHMSGMSIIYATIDNCAASSPHVVGMIDALTQLKQLFDQLHAIDSRLTKLY